MTHFLYKVNIMLKVSLYLSKSILLKKNEFGNSGF